MDIVIRRLEFRSSLSADERDALRRTFARTHEYMPGQDLLREGEKPAFVGALLSGFLCRYKPLADGLRQTVSFPLPGDIFDLHSFLIETMDHSVAAITTSKVAMATHASVELLAEAFPRLGALLWRDAVVEGSIFREWVVNCGRRTAYSRIAHLFCELYTRLAEIGSAQDGSCALPLTQSQISDATGMSIVHVNRVLARLRSERIAEFRRGALVILNWDALADAAGFNPAYLHAHEKLPGRYGIAFKSHAKHFFAPRRGAILVDPDL